MKLRYYLLTANIVSTGLILTALFICYQYMLLLLRDVILLTAVTVCAAGASMLIHYWMTRPLEISIHAIAREAASIAQGEFQGQVPELGPIEFQKLAKRFNEMSDKLQESFQRLKNEEASRRELVANVSHDLRTPMASIQAFVEALQDDIVSDRVTFDRYLKTIQLETVRLNDLIEELFKLSQLEAGGLEFKPELYHVDALLLDTLQSLAVLLEEKRLNVQTDVPEMLPPALLMPLEVKRVISNILHNAIRHSSVNGTIWIEAELLSEQFVQIRISDEGEGMEQHEQLRIFERFYRADPSRTRTSGGAGLGLAIAKFIIDLHGGEIGVWSEPGRGSQFWFTLPICSLEQVQGKLNSTAYKAI
ncbi:HAMP domain-containing sensor histidine kinase [Paenibacillus hexagrammi]|uniref:histidine kinase n=1 Tax=Paenibacillus hexagrammi TaxID=2908839 RepID=A0ABY3SEL5_9BACL|nr:HAMP domain-containing sensor histidine kinase [Paenibacillus sp. YPD9-1]UJF32429.1 HAMP domain-containing histidine kinase [Paenibacillus sp. YPD9-1]